VKKRQVPFSRIAEKQTDFLHRKYVPRGLSLKDPRAMKREEMIDFFGHIRARQESELGTKDAFRFKAVLSSRKKGTVQESMYPEQILPAPTPVTEFSPLPPPTPDPTPVTATSSTILPVPAPAPAPRPKPRPRQKIRADTSQPNIPTQYSFNTFETDIPSVLQNTENDSRPFLSLDPQFNVDQRIELDPTLDPDMIHTQPGSSSFTRFGLPIPQYTLPDNFQYLNSQYLNTPALTPAQTPDPDSAQDNEPAPSDQDNDPGPSDQVTKKPASRPKRKKRKTRR
jgi:hypothetical protein